MNISISVILLALFSICFGEEEVIQEEKKELKKLKVTNLITNDECGRRIKSGDKVQAHYVGTLADNGEVFDSSYKLEKPLEFQIGVGQVMKAWDTGLLGMCVGDKRRLFVPPHLGYGEEGAGVHIPPGADIEFEMEILGIEDGEKVPNMFKMADYDENGKISTEEMQRLMKENMLAGRKKRRFSDDELAKIETMSKYIMEDTFRKDDHDKDGHIDWEEFSGPKHDEL